VFRPLPDLLTRSAAEFATANYNLPPPNSGANSIWWCAHMRQSDPKPVARP